MQSKSCYNRRIYKNDEHVVQAKRPFNSQMSKEKLKAQGINVPNWKDGLKRYLEEAKNEE